MAKKTVLVTGCGGFIGGHVCVALHAAGYVVAGIDKRFPGVWRQPNTTIEHPLIIDVGNGCALDLAVGRFDLVVHLAAESRLGTCMSDPVPAVRTNVLGTANILDEALVHRAAVIYAGSSTAVSPEDNTYNLTKYQGEQLCRLWSRDNNLPVCVARFFNVYGPHEWAEGPYVTAVAKFGKQYRDGEQLTVYGTGLQTRDFIDVRDVAEAVVLLAGQLLDGTEIPQTIDVGTGRATRIIDVARRWVSEVMARVTYVAPPYRELTASPKIDGVLRGWAWRPKYDVMDWIDEQRTNAEADVVSA